MPINISVKTVKGAKYGLSLDAASETVLDVKKKIFAMSPSDEVSRQKLIYAGKELKDDAQALSQLKPALKEGSFSELRLALEGKGRGGEGD